MGWLSRISPEAIGRAARFACRVAIRLPDEQREEPCAARSQEVERALAGCGIAAVEDDMREVKVKVKNGNRVEHVERVEGFSRKERKGRKDLNHEIH